MAKKDEILPQPKVKTPPAPAPEVVEKDAEGILPDKGPRKPQPPTTPPEEM